MAAQAAYTLEYSYAEYVIEGLVRPPGNVDRSQATIMETYYVFIVS